MAALEEQHASAQRKVLLGQLAYLIDEIEALQEVVGQVPETLLTGRPLADSLSIKEAYGGLATLDEAVRLPRLRTLAAGEKAAPVFEEVTLREVIQGEDWNEQAMPSILAQVQQARRALVDLLGALPADAWQRVGWFGGVCRDVYGAVHDIIRQDVALLREMGYRLHESHFGSQIQGLPKEANGSL